MSVSTSTSSSEVGSGGVDRWLRLTDGQLEALKRIAFASMLTDHFGRYAFGLGTESWAFAAGRLAFPLFAFVLASNLARDGLRADRAWRTSRRLAVWAAISVLPSWWARDAWLPVNVLATLSIGAVLCALFESSRPLFVRAFVGVGCFAGAVFVEFGVPGVLLVVATQRLLVVKAHSALWLTTTSLALIAGINMLFGGHTAAIATFGAVASTLAVKIGQPTVARLKWTFYLAYPLHLLAIGVVNELTK